MAKELNGKKVAVLMTDGVEQVEYTEPRKFLEEHGAQVTLVSPKPKGEQVQGFNHLEPAQKFEVELDVRDARPAEFDALVLPGGVANPDKLRMDSQAVAFVRAFAEAGKPIASICHGPWTLVEAGVVRGKTLTSWPSLQTDIRNAGAEWRDEESFTCRAEGFTLVTSRKPDDLDAFNAAAIAAFAG